MEAGVRFRYWFIMVLAMLVPGLGYAVYFVSDFDAEFTQSLYIGSKWMLLLMPVLGVVVLQKPFETRQLVWNLPSPRYGISISIGIILGLLIFGLMAALMATPLSTYILEGAPVVVEKLGKLGVMENFILYACVISLIHSALEEYYWRWFVFKRLRWLVRGWGAHGIAAVAFSLHHYILVWIYFNPWMAIFLGTATAIGGFLWSVLYERTGTLAGPWVSHVIVDFAIFWVAFQMMAA